MRGRDKLAIHYYSPNDAADFAGGIEQVGSPQSVLDELSTDRFTAIESYVLPKPLNTAAQAEDSWSILTSSAHTSKPCEIEFAHSLLCAEAAEAFAETSHAPLLLSLWNAAFPSEEFARMSEQWMKLGFQSPDPIRDLRGTGALGLRLLCHYSLSSGAAVLRECARGEAGADSFPLASASLNVTQMLCSHLGLSPKAGGAGAVDRCSAATLDTVLRLQATLPISPLERRPSAESIDALEQPAPLEPLLETTLLDLMHEQCLGWLYRRWERLEAEHSCPTRLLAFPRLLTELSVHLHTALAQHAAPPSSPTTLRELLLALRHDGDGPAEGWEDLCRWRDAYAECVWQQAAALASKMLTPAFAVARATCPLNEDSFRR